VQASGDGERWISAAAPIDLRVVPPWYLRAWVWTLAAAILIAMGLAWYRVRVAHLLRLERQRTEIAMDLHDEIGAGLGSIGLLAELAEDGSVPEAERAALAGRIARQAKTLGGSVADIVWSLRSGAETLDALVLALRERAAELAPDGAIEVIFRAPDPVPPIRLSLPVRRHAQWIVVEAVRNAVRHASARTIRVSLAPDGAAWRLAVEDDGRGIEAADGPRIRGGVGRESMERRSAAIGGHLEIESSPSGTRVALTFQPGGRRPRMNV
jgi:signal transduction histidine kinase